MKLRTRPVMLAMLGLQLGLAAVMLGRDLAPALATLSWPSAQPSFDTPVRPGDQTRRYAPSDMRLVPAREGNPERPFQSTGDMPSRLQFDRRGEVMELTGTIAPGDAVRFAQAFEQAPGVTSLRLNSPGGSVQDALLIGRSVRDTGLRTAMGSGDICLSACPYILAAGVVRVVDDAAQVGVHQHFFGEHSLLPAFLAVEDIQRGQGEVMDYLDSMGIDPLLMRHALVTPPDEIYVLLPEELIRYRMVTPADG